MLPFLFWFGFKENFLVERKLFSTNVNNIQIKTIYLFIYLFFLRMEEKISEKIIYKRIYFELKLSYIFKYMGNE